MSSGILNAVSSFVAEWVICRTPNAECTDCLLFSSFTRVYLRLVVCLLRTALYYLLYRHECLTRKYTTREIHTKPHPGLEWHIFHILTSEDIDAFADIKFVS